MSIFHAYLAYRCHATRHHSIVYPCFYGEKIGTRKHCLTKQVGTHRRHLLLFFLFFSFFFFFGVCQNRATTEINFFGVSFESLRKFRFTPSARPTRIRRTWNASAGSFIQFVYFELVLNAIHSFYFTVCFAIKSKFMNFNFVSDPNRTNNFVTGSDDK